MGDVVELAVATRLDIPVERCLRHAAERGLTEVVIVGFDSDGKLFFSASKADAGSVLYQLEAARHRLMRICLQADGA